MAKISRLAILGCVAILAAAGVAAAQATNPPLAGRPLNFSGLLGTFSISASVDRTRVVVEDAIVLRVTIAGTADGSSRPKRSQLRIFPDNITSEFYIEPLPANDRVGSDGNRWEFAWRLRPKSTDVREIPSLTLSYFGPLVGRYQTARSEPIEIEVTPRVRSVNAAEMPADLPETFLQLASGRASDSRNSVVATFVRIGFRESLVGAILTAAIACGLWRRGGVSVSPAESPALCELKKRPEAARGIVAAYFRSALALCGDAPAAEIDRQLKRRGATPALRREWQDWITHADASAFGPAASDKVEDLAARAAELITKTEPAIASTGAPRLAAIRLAGVAIVFVLACSAAADERLPREAWNRGRQAFDDAVKKLQHQVPDDGLMTQAAQLFRQAIANQTPTADAYLDLGNALFLTGDLPAAMAAFRNGLAIDPQDRMLRSHLNFARGQVVVGPDSGLVLVESPWLGRMPLAAIHIGGVLAVAVGCFVLLTAAWTRFRPRIVASLAVMTIGLVAVAISDLSRDALHADAMTDIAVITEELPLRAGGGNLFEPIERLAPLPRGYEVRVLGERGGWLHVEAPGNRIGWLPQSKAIRVRNAFSWNV